MVTSLRYIRRFSELGMKDVPLVGGKNASLGEMVSALSARDIKVPNGFAITAEAYRYFIEHNQLTGKIGQALETLETHDINALTTTAANIRSWINKGEFPTDLEQEIHQAYQELAAEYGPDPDVAVRSSATAEDLPTASFAGQQETYLNIRGSAELVRRCRQVFASLFTDRAISYRVDKGFAHMAVALSIGVQKMVRADLGASGVMFTLDTETGFRDVVFITATYGLGENIVQGKVNPDEFYVFKPTLETDHRPILKRQRGDKAIKMIYIEDANAVTSTKNVAVPQQEQHRFALSDDEVLQLARYGVIIEQHYSQQAGRQMPMDIEWAKDGSDNELYILQARPETVQSTIDTNYQEVYTLNSRGTVLAQGKSIGQRIAAGPARVILDTTQMDSIQAGDVLVTDITDPDWEPVMKTAAAIVTNRGGRTCHAAIVARELGIPAVVGCGNATEVITEAQPVTVSCAEGDTGIVYDGVQDYQTRRINLRDYPDNDKRPQTKVMMNVGNPEQAFEFSRLPNDGVGLARLEFIISSSIRIHPRALLDYGRLDEPTRTQIDPITAGYKDHKSFYIERLAEGIGTIAAAFYPKPVIVRCSDFKSNEYASLIGGSAFEPDEENPMIGFRGAGRYLSKEFSACFALECAALKKVRETMGLDNVIVMIPFVRTVGEATGVNALMAEQGLRRGEHGLQIYMMCEIPANVLLADQFLELYDGFSIGSNDLTQLTLGIDRDSGIVSGFDERNEAVTRLIAMAIDSCHKQQKYIGICGQAPSDYPELTAWVVEQGIDAVSLNPDGVLSTTQLILDIERQLDTGQIHTE